MQLVQQLDLMRTRKAVKYENEDILVYTCVTLFLVMTTILLVILSL
jgi:hypothetical protein